jgi:folate-binding protein YgfZ
MKTLPLHEEYIRAGADFGEEPGWIVPGHFGDPTGEYQAAVERAALFDLSCRTKVELAGPEARAFLHNLCTQDVKNLPLGGGCEAFLITSKGRVVAHVLVGHYLQPNSAVLWLDTVPDQADVIGEHLEHYLISEQVELADRTLVFGMLHVCGSQAGAIIESVTGQSVGDLQPLHNRGFEWPCEGKPWCNVRRTRSLGLDGYDLIFPAEQSLKLWTTLREAGAVPAGAEAYETLRIEAGTPEFGVDIKEERFVMEVGRTEQAISMTKGCYLGQESVVMARDRGHVNRTLMGVAAPRDGLLPVDGRLYKGAEEVGQITSSTESPRLQQVIALAYLRRGSQEPGTQLVLEPEVDGRTVIVCRLPFQPASVSA